MDSVFSANEPTLGYLHQIRYGLFLILEKKEHDARLLIEKLDDISITTSDALDVYQTKLHIKGTANLTNASTDLWKTIRVWSDGIDKGIFDPESCLFTLITTANASIGSIPYLLRQDTLASRDVEDILGQLLNVSSSSKSGTNKACYDAFRSIGIEKQKKLLKKIVVIDASIDINTSKHQIEKILFYSTLPDKVSALFERLEGWFIGQIIKQLQNERFDISGREVHDKVLNIADSLKADNLPADFMQSIAAHDDLLQPYRNHVFVKQLQIIGAASKSINHAISDYHRAFSQKSKWIREGLITPTDDLKYDGRLIEDWERKFAIIEDCNGKGEDAKKLDGKRFYESHYVQTPPAIYIKERFKEHYMITGSCQMLSDKKSLGWHPEYKRII